MTQIDLLIVAVLSALMLGLWTMKPGGRVPPLLFSLRGPATAIIGGMLTILLIVIFQVYRYR